jgi:hypothetical protein
VNNLFTKINPKNEFTEEEIEEIHRLMRLPENELLNRFIWALWHDRDHVIKKAVEYRDESKRINKGYPRK